MNAHRIKKGFTLIELLVVISIVGLLSSVVLAAVKTAREKSTDAAEIKTLTQLKTALELYYDKYGAYPPTPTGTSNDALAALYGLTCWDCPNSPAPLDSNRLSSISEFLAPRPSNIRRAYSNCSDSYGYFYKVSASRNNYKLALVCAVNLADIPSSMRDYYFGGVVASIYSSDTSKIWAMFDIMTGQ